MDSEIKITLLSKSDFMKGAKNGASNGTMESEAVVGVGNLELSNLTPELLLSILGHAQLMRMLSQDPKGITTEISNSEATQKIILPAGMSLLDGAKELKNMHTNLEQEISTDYSFTGHDWKDVLHAIKNVSEETFGWLHGVGRGSFSPHEIDIVVDVKDGQEVCEKCFYGEFRIAGWEDAKVEIDVNNKGTVTIYVVSKKKFSKAISEYFKNIRLYLTSNSIYRGKTVVVTKIPGMFSTGIDYQIIENKSSDPIILNESEQLQLDNFIIGDLEVPGKKSYLFIGNYGNGKTETAMNIGRLANNLNIPFFYIKDASLFERVLALAHKYQPCIIFQEDLDETTSGTERDERMNKIINTIDGTETKGRDITLIFTTNHEDKINPALKRPGRIDLVLEFTNPSDETKISILQRYLRDCKGSDTVNYEELVKLVGDVTGAVVAQMAKRAVKLAKRKGFIDDLSLKAAILSMGPHIKFMSGSVTQPSVGDQFSNSFADLVLSKVLPKMKECA